MSISAERICLALRSRGIPSANVEGYKPLLRAMSQQDQLVVDQHLKRVVMGADDLESRLFMDALRDLAMGVRIATSDPLLAKLSPFSAAEQANRFVRKQEPAQAGLVPAKSSLRSGQEQEVGRRKHYVYGNKSAFMFELDWLKSRPGESAQKRTVTVESALLIGARNYDWASRISFQLTLLELPQFTAVMLGMLAEDQVWAAQNHGRLKDKFFRAKEQSNSVFLKLEQAGLRCPIRVEQAHRYQITSICLQALKHNDDHLDVSIIRELCQASLPGPV